MKLSFIEIKKAIQKKISLKGKKHFAFRNVRFKMPREHPRADDPAVYLKNLKFRRKVWARSRK